MSNIYPLIPLRDIVVFPRMAAPLFIGRNKSIKSIEAVHSNKTNIVLVAQKSSSIDFPKEKDLYSVGVLANILQMVRLTDGTLKILVEATKKVKIIGIQDANNNFEALVDELNDDSSLEDLELKALHKSVLQSFQDYAKYSSAITNETFTAMKDCKDSAQLANIIAANTFMSIEKKQAILELDTAHEKIKQMLIYLEYEIGLLSVEKSIRDNVRKEVDKTNKDFFLNEQLRVIHKELGDTKKDGKTELEELEEKIKATALSTEAHEKAKSELQKLKSMNLMSAEATILRNYLDYLLDLPWGVHTTLKHNLKAAEKILNKDHHGLEKIKDSILEFLSVQKRTKSMKGPILCLVGPPGVGKTSLARSIASAMGRNFVKFSLGGVRDESEIRGHRKTYVGSMPGKIMYLLKKAGSSNSLMLLDEIDKLSSDHRGTPSSALLEVLDPEQNSKFVDHYLEVEFDLSKVMFIATANYKEDIHPALLDRMEIVKVSGYTEEEKSSIVRQHLLKKQYAENKLTKKEFSISKEAITDLIRYYTHEAGVRNLERELSKIVRKVVRELEQKSIKFASITPELLEKYLGVRKFKYGESEQHDLVGVTTGLAYTSYGGDLLSIEAVLVPGSGNLKTTGELGNVMMESAQAAYSYFCSKSLKFGVDITKHKKKDLHLHVPEGAVPKDGPSAGIAMFTSIVSVITNIPVRKTVAMTGEITLSGRVLPIGGLKEKLLAAHRGGIKTVLIPHENKKDLSEIPENVTSNLEVITVSTADDVVHHALTKPLVASSKPIETEEVLVPLHECEGIAVARPQSCVLAH